ncbi:major facilitator family transporter [Corallococcus coralloides]|uniref:Major facilitator family transporter n=1 Tax=Corallococcus coralloides TaxID=184914 RepID=A0A410RM32_CORCK|nr:hypothetical protein [Corallococcus coralloides]QAT82970.1 major facilitator family transporter [Corallococcus coralloides]
MAMARWRRSVRPTSSTTKPSIKRGRRLRIRTSMETYTPAWVVAGGICLAAALVVLRIGRGTAQHAVGSAQTPVSG